VPLKPTKLGQSSLEGDACMLDIFLLILSSDARSIYFVLVTTVENISPYDDTRDILGSEIRGCHPAP
jgi:hypothetical protein